MNDKLFFSVWNNVVLFREIYKQVQLYKKNECVRFNSRKELLEYQEKEYIKRIEYWGNEQLDVGDLPCISELKEIEIGKTVLIPNHGNEFDRGNTTNHLMVPGEVIPYGVEIMKYCWSGNNYNIPKTPITTLPSTVHTVLNANIGFNDNIEHPLVPRVITIPSNIIKLTCNVCSNVSGIDNGRGYVDMSKSSIKHLSFHSFWYNEDIPLRKGDFPNGITHLMMFGIKISKIAIDGLPNTLIELGITYDNGSFGIIPKTVEKLKFVCCTSITKQSKLSTLLSVKSLSIYLQNLTEVTIEPNSLPPNITELTLEHIHKLECNVIPSSVTYLSLLNIGYIQIGSIPNSVTSLTIRDPIETVGVLPTSITHLDFSEKRFQLGDVLKVNQMISNLPNLTSIKLSKSFKNRNLLILPGTIQYSL